MSENNMSLIKIVVASDRVIAHKELEDFLMGCKRHIILHEGSYLMTNLCVYDIETAICKWCDAGYVDGKREQYTIVVAVES